MTETSRVLDWSFCELKSVADLRERDPVVHVTTQTLAHSMRTPADASGKGAEDTTEAAPPPRTNRVGLRLCYNKLPRLDGLAEAVAARGVALEDVEWIDASYNCLRRVDEALAKFPNLRVLNLHGNELDRVADVFALRPLTHLVRLSLHGNEKLQVRRFYRMQVIDALPQLKALDFIGITPQDRDQAAVCASIHWRKKA